VFALSFVFGWYLHHIRLIKSDVLFLQIFGRNLLWYTIVFGAIAAVSRKVVVDELQVIDPEGAMCLAVHQTHYMPKRWRGKESSELVRREYDTLFPVTNSALVFHFT
jgi:autophagy-related protein 9